MRQCPFNGCAAKIDPSLFSCRKHWFSLKQDQKNAIYDCYRKWQSGEIDGDELRRRQQAVLDETAVGGRAE